MTSATASAANGELNVGPAIFSRILHEGYGTGAWHGPDLKAALADVTADTAFRRPAAGRHNIAEIVLHHAWTVRSVIAQLGGRTPPAFPLDGAEWFEVDRGAGPNWDEIRAILDSQQDGLEKIVADIAGGRTTSPLSDSEARPHYRHHLSRRVSRRPGATGEASDRRVIRRDRAGAQRRPGVGAASVASSLGQEGESHTAADVSRRAQQA